MSSISKLYRLLLIISLSGFACKTIVIQNTRPCSVAGLISNGGFCADTLNGGTASLTSQQMIDLIEARPEPYPDSETGIMQPAHGAAVIDSDDDYNTIMTEIEQACTILGKNCSYQLKQAIQSWKLRKEIKNGSTTHP